MSYNPKGAKDPERAKSLAIAFRDNTANKTLPEIGADSANRPAIVAFQEAAGISADGKVGPQTMGAYAYWAGLPAPAAARPPPKPAPAPTAAPAKPLQASMFGVPKSVLLVGTLAALGLAFHKKIGRAIG